MWNWVLISVLSVVTPQLYAEKLEDIEAAQKKSQEQYIERYSVFTQEPDVMGKAAKPDGSVVKGGRKTKFNEDDGNNFQSPHLTEHFYMFDTDDEAFNKAQRDKVKAGQKIDEEKELQERTIYAGTSPHGELKDSSEIERKDGELNKKFNVPKTKQQRKEEEEQNIEYRGVVVRQKKEIKKQLDDEGNIIGDAPQSKGKDKNDPKKNEKTITIFKDDLRDEAKEAYTKIGEQAYKAVERAAKGPEGQNDDTLLPDPEFLIEGANRALVASWNNDSAKLAQRRYANNFASREGGVKEKFTSRDEGLSEDLPTCDKLYQVKTQKELKRLEEKNTDPKAREEALKRLEDEKKQCSELTNTSYKDIDPRFLVNKDDPKTKKLQNKGITEEDGKQRDYRVGLDLRSKVGKRIKDVQSEWKYENDDEKSEVTLAFDEKGNPTVKKRLRMDEQVQLYNDDLKGAADDVKAIKQSFPGFQVKEEDILANQIPLGRLSVDQITKLRSQSQYEDFSSPVNDKDEQAPQTYEQLLKKNSK